jgi:hypothetical protein
MKSRILFSVFCLVVFPEVLLAGNCPDPEVIRLRELPRELEWTVDEQTTLEELLAVKSLYAVRISNYGEYVTCHYTTNQWPVKLDAKPVRAGCLILPDAGRWTSTDSGQLVCREEDVNRCGFQFECNN